MDRPVTILFLLLTFSALADSRGQDSQPVPKDQPVPKNKEQTPARMQDESRQSTDISESQRTWFEKKIRPLLVNRCYSCHSRQKGKAEGDLVLDSRDGWQKGGQEGPSIIPGDPDARLAAAALEAIHPAPS